MRRRTLSRALLPALALGRSSLAGAARAADRLGSLPIDPAQISVSGISSGAFMANQLHVAHSASLMGAGLVAGGLYGCAVFDATEAGVQPMASLALGPCMTAPSLLQPADDLCRPHPRIRRARLDRPGRESRPQPALCLHRRRPMRW